MRENFLAALPRCFKSRPDKKFFARDGRGGGGRLIEKTDGSPDYEMKMMGSGLKGVKEDAAAGTGEDKELRTDGVYNVLRSPLNRAN